MATTPSLSQYHIAQLMRASVRGISFTAAPVMYMSLYITDPGPLNTGTEVSAGLGYVRRAITFADVDFTLVNKGSMANSSAIADFGVSTGNWNPGGGGVIGYMGLHDSLGIGTGNLLWYGPLDNSRVIDGSGLTIGVQLNTIILLMG